MVKYCFCWDCRCENILKNFYNVLRMFAVHQGEVGLEPGLSWIINGVSSLQRRLHVAESELSQRYVCNVQ